MKKIFALLLLSVALLACTSVQKVGDSPEPVRISALKAGKHTKEDVQRLLGSPTSITLFEKESWLYIESTEEQFAFLPPEEVGRKVIQVTFTPDMRIEKITQYRLDDGQKIAFDSQKTPSFGKNLNPVEEIIGNFGRFPANTKQGR